MKSQDNIPLVMTRRERCRMCYTCVRECPAKAIRIVDGQAEVMPERCVGCGNCVRVCSQTAKVARDCTGHVRELLAGPRPVAACVAPSFPAEFSECDYRKFVGMLRALGFEYVFEVAFGADLVAEQYARKLAESGGKQWIATTCPAVVAFVERYHPELVGNLMPIVSPMIAMSRVVRRLHPDIEVVFIGPCIAKKGEMLSEELPDDVAATMVFSELRQMFFEEGIAHDRVKPGEFDPPYGGLGALFPIGGGLLQAADLCEDLISGKIVSAEGREPFVEAIKEFGSGDMDVALLDVLACNGCIAGPGIRGGTLIFRSRRRVGQYVRQRMGEMDLTRWRADVAAFADLDLGRKFDTDDQRLKAPSTSEVERALRKMGKETRGDELNCGACGYETCREHAVAICQGLAESEMCLPYLIDQLRKTVLDLAISNDELAKTQQALMQSEKLASMGQLAAGIAHELNNPLAAVLMYSHMIRRERLEDNALSSDLGIIADQAERCKKIVAGLLHFARQNKVLLEPVDLRDVVRRSLVTVPMPDTITTVIEHGVSDPVVAIDRDQIIQVLTNLLANARAAMEKGGTLTIRTEDVPGKVRIRVGDTGVGIPKANLSKIFEPFFTTKAMGKGTGLGLAVTYGIVKMHSGDITVVSNDDPAAGTTGTTFTVTLPRNPHGGNRQE